MTGDACLRRRLRAVPKRSLSPDAIAAAALALGDRDGQAAMSMRRIAAELGCDPMAIYRHFPNREALLDAVADLALAGVVTDQSAGAGPGEGSGFGWEGRLTTLLSDVREAALRHPGIAGHIASRPPLGVNGLRLHGVLDEALVAAGLSRADVVKATQALIAYLAAALAMAVRAGERDERWHQVSEALGHKTDSGAPDREVDSAHLPIVGSAEQFAFGLRLLVNGIRVEGQRNSV
ncbi:TetR/AcrR family transcriptional regulator [Actinoplanes sichuanensis]|uniref:TetR/AcrR family transcriptional regulator n=1 Tax=Actinoplanes sichuanensis TaxID=512349 RepID=A0ABW4A4J7_9ACTN|nr:TetR/AcrR family transcriptional regulator [Actinoplanes sichuanensis]